MRFRHFQAAAAALLVLAFAGPAPAAQAPNLPARTAAGEPILQIYHLEGSRSARSAP